MMTNMNHQGFNRCLRLMALAGCVVGLARAEVDWAAPEWTARHEAATRDLAATRAGADASARAAMEAVVREWEAEQSARRRAGNVRGQAVADAAVEIFRAAAEAMAAGRAPEWPESPRRELAEPIRALRGKLTDIETERNQAVADAEATHRESFLAAVREADATRIEDEASAERLFRAWLAGEAMDAPGPGGTGGDATGEDPESAEPEFFAESGPGVEWTPLARWTADMMGPDILDIPVFDRKSEKGRKLNPMSGRESDWAYEAITTIPPGVYAFRLRRMEDRHTVEVLSWPRPEPDGVLKIRTRNHPVVPARHGFELQYAPAGTLVSIPVRTDPPGVQVFVNGQPYREGGREFRSPGVIKLPEGTYALRLTVSGRQDVNAPAFEVKPGQKIEVRLPPLPGRAPMSLRADARAGWRDSGVQVKRGDRIQVEASGQWSAAGGVMCGPDGYPNTAEHGRFYLDPRNSPRQLRDRPYGMLLARVGDEPPIPVGARQAFAAPADGPLRFDINEAEDPKHRRDNQGMLDLKVIVIKAEAGR
jgi:hypothetical protein